MADSRSIIKGMNLGLPEMIFIFLLALIIFGPKKLPEIGRQIGKVMNDIKRASNDFKSQIESEMSNMEFDELRRKLTYSEATSEPPSGTVPKALPSGETSESASPAEPNAVPTENSEVTPPELNQVAKAPDA